MLALEERHDVLTSVERKLSTKSRAAVVGWLGRLMPSISSYLRSIKISDARRTQGDSTCATQNKRRGVQLEPAAHRGAGKAEANLAGQDNSDAEGLDSHDHVTDVEPDALPTPLSSCSITSTRDRAAAAGVSALPTSPPREVAAQHCMEDSFLLSAVSGEHIPGDEQSRSARLVDQRGPQEHRLFALATSLCMLKGFSKLYQRFE
ncbi:hypothetical protein, conserved [Eimeria tenella]|uniref:Uncharacterized protein n=1 Tax=Eimeria tenella TaxID=5802 RepID=U6KZB7_EIMTE|nr:hypothetical protein, conserved [Eimeria tenella]CDJ43311.1 hypothetical protein, conserved [Eimeria tenella]|eukprot:XP_013234061.1 hypothetical protein, conserved [Eimeria tenella]